MALPARLAILTAVIAVSLVFGGSQVTVSGLEREHREADRREAVSLAQTLASYLESVAPDGNRDSVSRAFASWEQGDISGADAWVFLVDGDRLVPLRPGAAALPPVDDAIVTSALARRREVVAFRAAPNPAWSVAVPLGSRPFGVLRMSVNTRRDEMLAAQRRRIYLVAWTSALLVAVFVSALTAHWVGRPLNALGSAMGRASNVRGPDADAPEIGPREFRAVARRYNDLLRVLGERERESNARAALLALEERARGFDRLAVAAATTAELAHEIGTPLGTMRGHIQLLRDDLVVQGQTASVERVGLLLSQLDRVTGIVRAGLERGAWPAPAIEAVDLRDVAASLLMFLGPSLEQAGVRAAVETNGSSPTPDTVLARCDRGFVEQILLNLIKNAVEALSPGGHIRLTTGLANGLAFVVVADDGPGLPAAMRARVFDPFVTTKGNAGTGLGLSISRRLARMLGGELAYEHETVGTAWRLTLPAGGPA